MRELSKYGISLIAAGGLVASVLTTAFAGHSAPRTAQAGKNVTVTGNLQVNGVIKGNSNGNIKKNLYVRGKGEVDKGLLLRDAGLTVNTGGVNVKAGGVTTDTLTASGQAQLGSLGVTGAETVGGTLVATGLLTANAGVNAGSGGLTTTGNVSAGAGSFSSVTDTGSLVAGSLAVSGNADFTHATVTGLSLSNIVGTGNLTLQSLTVGSPTANTPPLTLAANGKTVSLSVSSAGDVQLPALVTAGDANVGANASVVGNLSVGGSAGITASSLTSPLTTGTNPTLTPLALKGSSITLTGGTTIAGALTENGATTLNGAAAVNGNSDLTLAATTGTGATASHLVGNKDVDGQVTVAVPATATTEQTVTTAFTRPYNSQPTVVVTAAGDPDPWATAAPKVWVTLHTAAGGQYDGFVLHYVPPAPGPNNATNITYNYHVTG